jgi:hypothetical protein
MAMKADILLKRLRTLPIAQFIQCLRPKSIDALLWITKDSSVKRSCSPQSAMAIESFSMDHLSGNHDIDKRLKRDNIVYVVFANGVIAHESWVFFNTLLPAQYGFDPLLPVIGDSYTTPGFRNKGLFQNSLSYILEDLRSRNISRNAYIMTLPQNLASTRALEKAGCQLLAQLKGTRVLGLFILNKSTKLATAAQHKIPIMV